MSSANCRPICLSVNMLKSSNMTAGWLCINAVDFSDIKQFSTKLSRLQDCWQESTAYRLETQKPFPCNCSVRRHNGWLVPKTHYRIIFVYNDTFNRQQEPFEHFQFGDTVVFMCSGHRAEHCGRCSSDMEPLRCYSLLWNIGLQWPLYLGISISLVAWLNFC